MADHANVIPGITLQLEHGTLVAFPSINWCFPVMKAVLQYKTLY